MINWSDPHCQVTPHFTVQDCLNLHEWGRLANEKDMVSFTRLIALCQKLEEIREVLKCPLNVHSIFRSVAYNKDQNIIPNYDVHSECLACDFDCEPHLSVEMVKNILRPCLETLDIRMERDTPIWIHIDMREPGASGREFKA
jgi:hypothetical protein